MQRQQTRTWETQDMQRRDSNRIIVSRHKLFLSLSYQTKNIDELNSQIKTQSS